MRVLMSLLLALAIGAADLAAAQTPPPAAAPGAPAESQTPSQPSRRGLLILGATCDRGPNEKGVVKRDACQRWYCGLASYKDPIEVEPDIARRANCTWTVTGGRCRCIPNPPR
jgi:hypothetical protein